MQVAVRGSSFLVCGVALLLLLCFFGQSTALAGPETVIAWNPSHQNDTAVGWHEYVVCGDITQRAMALLEGEFTNVLCWETGMGLTTRNYPALQSETDMANAANADIFIAVHTNTGAASGVLGNYWYSDGASGHYAEDVLVSVADTMEMKFHYARGRADVFVLDPVNNHAPIRVLLELGDSESDRKLLSSEAGRQKLAEALAAAVRKFTPPAMRHQETDSRIAYTGSWTSFKTSGASGGSYTYADSAASATITFNGTRLEWVATTGTTMGRASVTLDGGDPIAVDLHSATTRRQVKVWSTGELSDAPHMVAITWTGDSSAASVGTRVNIDAVEVNGSLTYAGEPPAPSPTRFQQTNAKIVYAGAWVPFSVSGASGGSYSYAASAASATVRFEGTQLDWVATTGLTMGRAGVSLDGGDVVSADLYSATTLRQQKVWSTGTLAPGQHTVVITWTGQPSASGGARINIDAFDVLGSLVQAPAPSLYEQNDSRIAYAGTWSSLVASGSSGGDYFYADSAATATVAFTGTSLDWIATKGVTMGRAYVSLDGAPPVLVDLYNPSVARRQNVWSTGILASGAHTVCITWTGQRSVAGGGTRVNIDAVVVDGTLIQAGS